MTRSRSKPARAFCNPERAARALPAACALLLLASVFARGADPSKCVLIEPKFMKHQVAYPIPLSQRAVFVPAFVRDGEPVFVSFKEFKAMGADWKSFLQESRENASAELKTLTPAYTRDRKNVIEYATLGSDSPLTASVVLAPDFLKMFAETLGPKVIVAIPNRFTVFVFPALAGNFQDYTQMVYDAYHATSWPVSMEAYEVSDKGIRTIGLYQEP